MPVRKAARDGVPEELHQTTWCAERSIAFIEANRDRPWLLSVNPYDPHPPFNPHKRYRDMFEPEAMPGPHFQLSDLALQERLASVDFQSKGRDPKELDIHHPILPKPMAWHGDKAAEYGPGARDAWSLQAAYYAMIKLIDDQLARILGALESTGQRQRTIVIFTSDHGEMLGDHGLIEKGCRFYEGLVRVPLVFNCPGRIAEGVVSDALVELMDKAPTVLDLAGVPAPERMQARSLQPILEGAAAPSHHRDFVRCEYYGALALPGQSLATMYRDRRHKLVTYHDHGLGELYDLEADPFEHDNLWDAPTHQELRHRLVQASFDATMAAIDRGPPRIGPM
jgi:arylsulfatase A-like enzyme